MYRITAGTPLLIMLLFCCMYMVRMWVCKNSNGLHIKKVDNIVFFACFFRCIWAIIVVAAEDLGFTFFVYDDETYYRFAMRYISESQMIYQDNTYRFFLRWIYDSFGRSALNGRLTSMFIVLTAVYLVAFAENMILKERNRYTATKLCAFSPFMVMVSFFEIKDIAALFLLIAGYALIKKFENTKKKATFVAIVVVGLLNEGIRSGTGALLVAAGIITAIPIRRDAAKSKRILSIICIAITIIVAVLWAAKSELIDTYLWKISQYQKWIRTQFSSNSIYNWFVIDDWKQIWKAPLSFALYALQPLNGLTGEKRFFGEFGIFARVIDVPVILMTLLFIVKYIKQEKGNSIIMLTQYALLSCVNLTNVRESIALYPLFYIAYACEKDSVTNDISSRLTRKLFGGKNWDIMRYMITLCWLSFVIFRVS